MRSLIIVVSLAAAVATQRLAAQAAEATSSIPFSTLLFTTIVPRPGVPAVMSLDLGYHERAFEPMAGERFEPRGTLLAPLSPVVSVLAQVSIGGTLDRRTRVAGQGELLITPLRRGGFSLTSGLGLRHEYSGTMVSLFRFTGARTTQRSALVADVLLEHPYSSERDAWDVITSVGASRALASSLWLGVEAVGSDLEGFWKRNEVEGGATLFVGPTLALTVSPHWRLAIGAGPVVRATTSTAVAPPTGYVLRLSLRTS